MNVDYLLNPDFYSCVLWFFSFGLLSWFMVWGVSFVTSLFIKILRKG